MNSVLNELPIDALLPEMPREGNVVLEAAPGAGKTTRVPAYLLERTAGQVLVLEPRRLAARLAARRVALERGEEVGKVVGYQVRFEDYTSRETRLRYLTEGVLNRRLAGDPELRGVGVVVLDEFHERHLEGDLALALLLRLQRTSRPDLRLVVMSATLDAAPIAAHLDGCPVLRSEGRLFPLEVRYTPESSLKLEERIAAAIDAACRDRKEGNLLVFLPGAAEIQRAMQASQAVAARHALDLAPLYGDLSPEEQDKAIQPGGRRKAIFATNIAESSVTIPEVRIVIDSGLARTALDSRSTGLSQLNLTKIPRSSAIQRAGRAARLGPGLCVRLYTEQDFLSRAETGAPEIVSRELSGLVLQLRAMEVPDPAGLAWLTPPPPESLARAESLLDELGAVGGAARRMAAMPVHPRLARLMLEASARGVVTQAAKLAALLSANERVVNPDLLHTLDRSLTPQSRRIAVQLERQVSAGREARDWERPLAECVLAAYPDRVAKRRRGEEYEIAGGVSAKLGVAPPKPLEWMVAVDADEMVERGVVMIRSFLPIEAEWLIELFPGSIEEVERYFWNREKERVEQESAILFHGLALDRTLNPRPRTAGACAALREKVRELGWRVVLDVEATESMLDRHRFAGEHGVSRTVSEPELYKLLDLLAEGRSGFDELREAAGNGEWRYRVDEYLGDVKGMLDRVAPERIQLPGGRSVRVNYPAGQPPWIASRLQDFIGMEETPEVGGVAVLVHLLAPNQRPVQMTQDLKSFWSKLYPELRGQLSRRYPKHLWP
jgi:ATP-dependent helicase HrpB